MTWSETRPAYRVHLSFVREIGLEVHLGPAPSSTFLPGIQMVSNGLRVDSDRLHEAGPLAVKPPSAELQNSASRRSGRRDGGAGVVVCRHCPSQPAASGRLSRQRLPRPSKLVDRGVPSGPVHQMKFRLEMLRQAVPPMCPPINVGNVGQVRRFFRAEHPVPSSFGYQLAHCRKANVHRRRCCSFSVALHSIRSAHVSGRLAGKRNNPSSAWA